MRNVDLHCPRPSVVPKLTDFEWSLPRYRTVISVLKNPFYAGVYAYGKSEHRAKIVDGRPRRTYGHSRPREDWTIFLRNHHEGYIEWPEYERNQETLARNNFRRPGTLAKSARGGRALLAGLLRCGHCGLRLQVAYCGHRPGAPRYRCDRPQLNYGMARCLTFGAWAADRAIAREALRVVEPLAIAAAMEAERQSVEKQAAERHVYELELEQTRYEAQLAERAGGQRTFREARRGSSLGSPGTGRNGRRARRSWDRSRRGGASPSGSSPSVPRESSGRRRRRVSTSPALRCSLSRFPASHREAPSKRRGFSRERSLRDPCETWFLSEIGGDWV